MDNKNTNEAKRYLKRWQVGIVIFAIAMLVLNIMWVHTILTTEENQQSQQVRQEDTAVEEELVETAETEIDHEEENVADEQVAEELEIPRGIVLLENQNEFLPLRLTINVNVFGWASVAPYYEAPDNQDSFLDSLINAGFEINTELPNFYRNYRPSRPMMDEAAQDFSLPEPSIADYQEELLPNAEAFSNVSVVFISRDDVEGMQPPAEYMSPSQAELELFNMVCDNFRNVIVIYDGPEGFDLSFVNTREQVQGVYWCPGVAEGSAALMGPILKGNAEATGSVSAEANETYIMEYNVPETSEPVEVEETTAEPAEEQMDENADHTTVQNNSPIILLVVDVIAVLLIIIIELFVVRVGYIRRKKAALRQLAKEALK